MRTTTKPPSRITVVEEAPTSFSTAPTTGIDVETTLLGAEQCIEARRVSIDNLRTLADQLRSALAQVEQKHEMLTGGCNPPMANAVVSGGGSVSRLR